MNNLILNLKKCPKYLSFPFILAASFLFVINVLNIFNFDTFREGQFQAIERIVFRKDSIILLPTGAGKSIIYQYFYPQKVNKLWITLI